MLKNIKVVTSIVIMLIVFSALLLVSSALSFNAISQDKANFTRASILTEQQGQLSDAWQTLVKTRVTINRVAIRILKKQTDPASMAAIEKLLGQATETLDDAGQHFARYKSYPTVDGQNPALDEAIVSSYQLMYDTMKQSIQFLGANNYEAYGNLEAQKAQDDLEKIMTAGVSRTASCWRSGSRIITKATAIWYGRWARLFWCCWCWLLRSG